MNDRRRLHELNKIISALQVMLAKLPKDATIIGACERLAGLESFPDLQKEIMEEYKKRGKNAAIERLLTKAHDLSQPNPNEP